MRGGIFTTYSCHTLTRSITYYIQLQLYYIQAELYRDVLRSKSVAALMTGRAAEPSESVLSIITSLRKLCNHPDLLHSSSSGNMQASSSASVPTLLCYHPGLLHSSSSGGTL